MDQPKVEGFVILEPLGGSPNGHSFRVREGEGRELVLKVFHDAAIQRDRIREAWGKLEAAGWPGGILPVAGLGLEHDPPYLLTPALLEPDAGGAGVPRDFRRFGGAGADGPVLDRMCGVARALAELHRCGVVHGNVKPSNLFLDASGQVLVADWALGNMPGHAETRFSDALLYQPPDQLARESDIALGGFSWDVFAFGVLAFRAMTGRFPRCDETYRKVSSVSERAFSDPELIVDLAKIAANLRAEKDVAWPADFDGAWGADWRDLLDRCLSLDPRRRPASMAGVAKEIEGMVPCSGSPNGPETGASDVRGSGPRRILVAVVLAVAVALAVIACLYGESLHSLRRNHAERTALGEECRRLREANLRLESQRDAIRGQHESERLVWRARLEDARRHGDLLFSWAMDTERGRLPSLRGRESRWRQWERHLTDRLRQLEESAGQGEEKGIVWLQLAEIALAREDGREAAACLEKVLGVLPWETMDATLRLRVVSGQLRAALAGKGRDFPVEEMLLRCRKSLERMPVAEVDREQLECLRAILSYHEARVLADRGEEEEALARMVQATRALNELADLHGDDVILRSGLAECRMFAADVLASEGRHADAREVRRLAVRECEDLARKHPSAAEIRLELAGGLAAIAEDALRDDDVDEASRTIRQAFEWLDSTRFPRESAHAVVYRRASLHALRAAMLADSGKADEALGAYEEAIRLLEPAGRGQAGDALSAYRLALAWWGKAGLLASREDRHPWMDSLKRAKSMLDGLSGITQPYRPGAERIHRTSAYLCVDLAHANQSVGRIEDARVVLKEALVHWEALDRLRPSHGEYQEGLIWCRQRIEDFGR